VAAQLVASRVVLSSTQLVCMYVCMYVCMHVCICPGLTETLCARLNMRVLERLYVCMRVCVLACVAGSLPQRGRQMMVFSRHVEFSERN
jgi:hypothetical protein